MSPQDKIGAGLIAMAAVALGIDFLVSPQNQWRRALLIFAIIVGIGGILIIAYTPGSIDLVGG